MRCERLIPDRLSSKRGADNFKLHRLEEKERLPPLHSTDSLLCFFFYLSKKSAPSYVGTSS